MTTDGKPAPALLGSKWVHRQIPKLVGAVTAVHALEGITLEAFIQPWEATIEGGPGMVTGGGHAFVAVFGSPAALEKDWKRLPGGAEVAALRSDLVEAMTPELGPRMARIAVFGDPGLSPEDAATYARATGPSAETIAAIKHGYDVLKAHIASLGPDGYDHEQRPIRITRIGLLADGGLSVGYTFPPGEPLPSRRYEVPIEQGFECEATVEITPEAEARTPFVCVSVADVAEVFSRSKGVPVAFVTDVPALRVALGSVVEMVALLRRLSENFYGDHDKAAEDIEEVSDLLARIDAAKAVTGG